MKATEEFLDSPAACMVAMQITGAASLFTGIESGGEGMGVLFAVGGLWLLGAGMFATDDEAHRTTVASVWHFVISVLAVWGAIDWVLSAVANGKPWSATMVGVPVALVVLFLAMGIFRKG